MSESRDAVGHAEYSADSDRESYLRQRLRTDIESAGRMLAADRPTAYVEVLRGLHGRILPTLREYTDRDLAHYDEVLDAELPWAWQAIGSVEDDTEQLARRLRHDDPDAKQTVRQALRSATAAAAHEHVVQDEYTHTTHAVADSGRVGTHIKRADMDFGDPVCIGTDAVGELKTFIGGGTGSGKTTATSMLFYDAWRRNFEGQQRKCLDYVGLGKAENVTYDLPMQYDDLRQVRKDMDLPPGMDAMDRAEPEVDIYVPLSEDTASADLPEEVIPFTIPASGISQGLLASVIDAQVTDSVEQTVRDAYDSVDNSQSDWSLVDMAEEIADRGDLSEKQRLSALRILKRLEQTGFIRTHEDDRALDWDEVFRSPERISVFSQAPLSDEFEQLIVVAYLLDRHWSLRYDTDDYPPATVWLRELWEIAEHAVQRRKRDDREQAVMEHIIHRLSRLVRKNRDIKTEVLADTQSPLDVEKGVRKLFNRYILFQGSDELVSEVLSSTGNSARQRDRRAVKNTLSERPGEGAVIGACEPAVKSSDMWGASPVRFAPPPWHAHDKDRDQSGWQARADYGDSTLSQPDWDTSIPEELQVDTSLPDDEDDEEDSGPDPKEVHKEMARQYRRTGLSIREIREELPENPKTGNNYSKDAVHRWTKDIDTSASAAAD